MNLPQSRKAFDLAGQAFARLGSVASNGDAFRDEFVPVHSDDSASWADYRDQETKGHRTPNFGTWWNAMAYHSLTCNPAHTLERN
jgi:hypothetical protein